MQAAENLLQQPVLSHVEPVLPVGDIEKTISYWHTVLGFPFKWTWGDPPSHGGVSWHGAYVQFSLQPKLALDSKGNSIFIRVRNLEELYLFHQKQNAEIVDPLENKPWGMAGYVVREINGYYIVFAGAPLSNREKSANAFPQALRITARKPTVKEFRNLSSSVGWDVSAGDTLTEKALAAAVFAVVAEDMDKHEAIGCVLLLGDNASFYYVKDLIVHPGWQHKHVGTALMHALTQWLEKNGADNALVGLYTGENLAPFYHRFGFTPIFGMHKRIARNENDK